MTHEELNGLYELYALGVLDSDEKDEIDAHLARECAECSAQLRRAVAGEFIRCRATTNPAAASR